MKEKISWIFLIFIIVVLFLPPLFLNFAQDDFYCLLISKANSLKDFLTFFTPYHSFVTSHYNFYRPLTTQFYFGLMQNLFGLNPFPFHLISLLVHVLNTFLVYRLAKEFLNNSKVSLLAAFIYGVNQSLTISIGWASNFQELLVTTFILFGVICYKRKNDFVSIICFVLALFSKETAISFPFVIFFVTLFYGKRRELLRLAPYLIILAVYIYFHFIKYKFPETESYQLTINKQVVSTLKWYFWWALGLPEMFLDYIGPRFTVLPLLWKMFFKEAVLIFSFFIVTNLLILVSFVVRVRDFSCKTLKTPVFLLIFYLLFLLPVLFFPNNKFPYHQTTALAGLSVLLALLVGSSRKILMVTFVSAFFVLQFASVNLTLRTNPITTRSKLADDNLKPFLNQYPSLPSDAVIFVRNDENYPKINEAWGGTAKQVYYAISGANSFKVYYGNGVRAYFEGVDKFPLRIETSKFIEITAKVPY